MSPRTLYRFETALESPTPLDALRREVAERIASAGADAAYDDLRDLLYLMRERHNTDGEDLVLDVMDSLSGWGNADYALVPPDQVVSR